MVTVMSSGPLIWASVWVESGVGEDDVPPEAFVFFVALDVVCDAPLFFLPPPPPPQPASVNAMHTVIAAASDVPPPFTRH
jgi:hypothetical protein